MKYKILILVGVVFLITFYVTRDTIFAQGGNPFGGRITYREVCACSNNMYLRVSAPRGGEFMYQPGHTKLYEFGQIRENIWLLGLWQGQQVCRQPSGDGCHTVHTGNLIRMTGTSR